MIHLFREEMEPWLEEAQDESRQEALENMLGHPGAMEEKYRHRCLIIEQCAAES